MTDSKEPVEPTEQELNRCYWAGHATLSEPEGQRSLLTEVNQITAGRLAIWRSGCETGRAFERLTRERKALDYPRMSRAVLGNLVDELAKQKQKAVIYGESAAQYRNAAIRLGLDASSRLDVTGMSSDDALAYARSFLVPYVDTTEELLENDCQPDEIDEDPPQEGERKRGERPNPVSFVSDATFLGATVTRFCAEHFEAGIRYAESGDSDELAALKEKLTRCAQDNVAVSCAHGETLSELAKLRGDATGKRARQAEAERDTEKVRADCWRRKSEQQEALLVERHAQVLQEKARADRAERELDDLRSDRWKLVERAVAAEDAIASHDARRICRHVVEQLSADLTQAKARIAELEEATALFDESVSRLAKMLECEDSLPAIAAKCDSLTRELAEAKQASAKHYSDYRGENARANKAELELAEAGEELRAERVRTSQIEAGSITCHEELLRAKDALHWLVNGGDDIYPVELDQHEINWHDYNEDSGISVDHDNTPDGIMTALVDAFCARGADTVERMANYREQPDAHRAKPSPQSPSATRVWVCNACGYEALDEPSNNAEPGDRAECPRLKVPGVLVRCPGTSTLVERTVLPPYETAPTLEKGVGYEVVARASGTTFRYQFVATGCERHSGEGWYQMADYTGLARVVRVESAPADDGPPRVGDVVRIEEVHRDSCYYDKASEFVGRHVTLSEIVTGEGTFDGWPAYGFDNESIACRVTVIRRAAQSPPATPEPRPGFATAAELAERDRRLDRLEGVVLAQATASATELDARAEIRAEREARKL